MTNVALETTIETARTVAVETRSLALKRGEKLLFEQIEAHYRIPYFYHFYKFVAKIIISYDLYDTSVNFSTKLAQK